ncbi:MAG: hypothetical protein HY996_04815 [Micrococcales bacterium]|nr:hypothetical protein [Micrococcales bacterium]
MSRIDIYYGGTRFSTGNRGYPELQDEIQRLVRAGGGWLEVNYGDGTATPATIYIAGGVTIALVAVAEMGLSPSKLTVDRHVLLEVEPGGDRC